MCGQAHFNGEAGCSCGDAIPCACPSQRTEPGPAFFSWDAGGRRSRPNLLFWLWVWPEELVVVRVYRFSPEGTRFMQASPAAVCFKICIRKVVYLFVFNVRDLNESFPACFRWKLHETYMCNSVIGYSLLMNMTRANNVFNSSIFQTNLNVRGKEERSLFFHIIVFFCSCS